MEPADLYRHVLRHGVLHKRRGSQVLPVCPEGLEDRFGSDGRTAVYDNRRGHSVPRGSAAHLDHVED